MQWDSAAGVRRFSHLKYTHPVLKTHLRMPAVWKAWPPVFRCHRRRVLSGRRTTEKKPSCGEAVARYEIGTPCLKCTDVARFAVAGFFLIEALHRRLLQYSEYNRLPMPGQSFWTPEVVSCLRAVLLGLRSYTGRWFSLLVVHFATRVCSTAS